MMTPVPSPEGDPGVAEQSGMAMPGGQPAAYQVALPVFEGPLALLLHLIERQDLDITQVSLAQVTNQYLEYLSQVSERNPDHLADFLVVAAKLLLIKSRVLLPQPPSALTTPSEEAEADIGEELIRQLIIYKQFKQAAGWLGELEASGRQSYIRLAGTPALERVTDLSDVTLDDLLAVVHRVLAAQEETPSVNGVVTPAAITIAGQIELIEQETSHGRPVSFRRLLERTANRLEIIVTLLAVLEMIKQLRVIVRQDRPFGEIEILRFSQAQPPRPNTAPNASDARSSGSA
ncbi:MAG: segregation/condensation protein A [Anaerolineae bacterium]|nr:segregation/condensation protein A [Anaerolineae bacterium]